jgi:hypothetical protein
MKTPSDFADRDNFDVVICQCDEEKEIEYKDFKEHLKTVHNIPNPKGTGEMRLHADGPGNCFSIYDLKVEGGITATRFVKSTWRTK